MHDLVIKNAVLVDGVGTSAFEGEIAVTGGKITAIGDGESLSRASAGRYRTLPTLLDMPLDGTPQTHDTIRYNTM